MDECTLGEVLRRFYKEVDVDSHLLQTTKLEQLQKMVYTGDASMEEFIAKWRVLANEVMTAVSSLPMEELLVILLNKLPVNTWCLSWEYITWDKTRVDQNWSPEKAYDELL